MAHGTPPPVATATPVTAAPPAPAPTPPTQAEVAAAAAAIAAATAAAKVTAAAAASAAAAAAIAAANEPVELQLVKSRDAASGRFSVSARVLNIAGKGLSGKTVKFTREGVQTPEATDSEGDAVYPNWITAPADGSDMKVAASVSGIRDTAIIYIFQRVPKTPEQVERDRTNNRRARYFLLATVVLWLVCLLVVLFFGMGKPLVDWKKASVIPQEQTTLTDQQIFFNNLPGVKGTEQEIKLPAPTPSTAPTGKWQKPLFVGVLLWSIFSIIYGILSFREEVAEAFRRGVEKLVDKRYNSASARDPLFERLMAFSGHMASTRRPTETTTTTPAGATTTTSTAVHGKNTFWELLRSDLLSDFVMEVLPGIVRAIRGR